LKTVTLNAHWAPRPGLKLGSKDLDGKLTYLGSKVWRDPRLVIGAKPIPAVSEDEVLIQVEACGICGSDVHKWQMGTVHGSP
jgi:(R,R)-butanediol dehydrogenase/meso-butanediol dehydrogenase/diacetyl reductase